MLYSTMEDVSQYETSSCIRGFHVYKSTWVSVLDEVLMCQRERGNSRDRYAVSILKNQAVKGHLPLKISSLFMKRNGVIKCKVTGTQRYSIDLQQGGMEIPCLLTFEGKEKEINKIKKIFKRLLLVVQH